MRAGAVLVSCLGLLVLAAVGAGDDRKEEEALRQAVGKVAGWTGYSFRIEAAPAGGAVEGKYEKDRPVWFKAEGIECFRKGDAVVYKQGERWLRSKTGRESDPLLVLGAVAKVRTARLPHEELAGFERYFQELRRGEDRDGTWYSGPLTAEAVKKLARSEDQGVARSGSARVWVGGKGDVVKYETVLRLQGRLGNAEIDGEAKKTVTLGDGGGVKVEVPEGAKKALQQ
jgi:hypothetical protein